MQDRSASVVMVAGSKLIGSSFSTPSADFSDVGAGDEPQAKSVGTARGLPARLQAPGLSPPLDVHVSERFAAIYHRTASHCSTVMFGAVPTLSRSMYT